MLKIISIPVKGQEKVTDSLVAEFLEAVRGTEEQINKGGRIYSTFVPHLDYVFMTASKDTHLELGTIPYKGQVALAKFLEREFNNQRISQALLVFDKGKEENSRSFAVSRVSDAEGTTFFLTPTH